MVVRAVDDDWVAKYPKAVEDICWLLHKANGVADQRNDAIHAPCSLASKAVNLKLFLLLFTEIHARKSFAAKIF